MIPVFSAVWGYVACGDRALLVASVNLPVILSPRMLLSVWSLPSQGYAWQSGGEDVVRPRPGAALLHLPGIPVWLYTTARGAELLHAANRPRGFSCALFCVLPFCFLPFDDTILRGFYARLCCCCRFLRRTHVTAVVGPFFFLLKTPDSSSMHHPNNGS